MKNNNIFLKKVILEKFTLKDLEIRQFKDRLHNSIFQSRGIPSEQFIQCISEMIQQELMKNKYSHLNIEAIGDLCQNAFSNCLKGFKRFNYTEDKEMCYFYFRICIFHSLRNRI